jgi:serine phosphatase RsbU (regulator of sigma subunit)
VGDPLDFLIRASDSLERSPDLATSLQALAELTVPSLADACVVNLTAGDGSIESAASSGIEAADDPGLAELTLHPIDPDGSHPVARAMRTGEREIVSEHSGSFHSLVVAPMKLHGDVLGALTLASFSEERTWDSRDLSLIEELARRAAGTVANARLDEERTQLARKLRESLLPPRLPELTGAEVAARLQPAAAYREISGDFYDVFGVGPYDWVISMGDVSGRGFEAASTTALARHSIRAAAIHGAGPAATLAVLNDALLSQPPELRLCAAVVGLLAIGSAGARLSIANGGHPPPLHLHADGLVEPIVGSGTLLGVMADPPLGEADVNLAVGDSVVFYTDGLTESRSNGRELRVEELVSVIEGCVDLDATVTAASIDQALLEPERAHLRDDAAILVVRILEFEDAPSREDEGTVREGRFRARRLAWSRWAGRGGESDRQP